jgi:cell wall assembly regulator SMI1
MNKQEDWKSLLSNFSMNPPADETAIKAAETELTICFPGEYRDFLKLTNGGEGLIGSGGYAAFWRVEELQTFNREYEVDKYAPGLFFFGSDGGGEAFAFDLRTPQLAIVQVPFIGMSVPDANAVASNFPEFLTALAQQRT